MLAAQVQSRGMRPLREPSPIAVGEQQGFLGHRQASLTHNPIAENTTCRRNIEHSGEAHQKASPRRA
eukprot:2761451-Prorocentrum_lima.AAC.1